MNGIWKKCVKRYVNTFAGFDSEHELERVREKILKLAKDLSLECEVEDVEELLDQESGELTNEELIELEEERVAEEEMRVEAAKEEEEPERKFTTNKLSEGLSLLNKVLSHFEKMDPNIQRFARIERMAHDVFRPYREIYEEKKKQTIQTKLTMFTKKTTPDTSSAALADNIDDPQPSMSDQ